MEQGGVLYWSELYPDSGNLNGSDERSCFIPASIKYLTMDELWQPILEPSGRYLGSYEEYDLTESEMKLALEKLSGAAALSELPDDWCKEAAHFLKNSLALAKDVSLAL
ncbi:hypothetical protein K7W42_01180 [Deinococcus sp. HMF7604]|uniref:hypothetical protein n=1 Tax=Deinococcus betulae TaxID=2873312 RepID=UPI001CCD62F7|nr:hypothetical protein [Deinococcus betulae]MBZ9749465.1 hypothetical protein [Deinococcus betulae]